MLVIHQLSVKHVANKTCHVCEKPLPFPYNLLIPGPCLTFWYTPTYSKNFGLEVKVLLGSDLEWQWRLLCLELYSEYHICTWHVRTHTHTQPDDNSTLFHVFCSWVPQMPFHPCACYCANVFTSVRDHQLARQGQRHDGMLVHQSWQATWGENRKLDQS